MSEGTSPLLEVSDLTKAYRRRVVIRDVSLAVRAGEAVAVAGPNGAGKSTFLGCVTANRLPDRGAVRICGVDPFSDLARASACLGWVPEQPFLYGELTVREMLAFVTEARRLPLAAALDEISRLLGLLGLEGAEDVLCRELSQGMGRKVAVIAALLHRPSLLILDEVLNGLDQSSTEGLLAELEARRAGGVAVLISSHDLRFLARWCDRGLLLAPSGESRLLEGADWRAWQASPALSLS